MAENTAEVSCLQSKELGTGCETYSVDRCLFDGEFFHQAAMPLQALHIVEAQGGIGLQSDLSAEVVLEHKAARGTFRFDYGQMSAQHDAAAAKVGLTGSNVARTLSVYA